MCDPVRCELVMILTTSDRLIPGANMADVVQPQFNYSVDFVGVCQ